MYKMTQYNSLNKNLSNSQLNKLKSAIENESELVLRLSTNMKVILMMNLISHTNYY